MHSENNTILDFHQDYKSDKTPFIINADLESLIEKIDGSKNNPGKSSDKDRRTYSIKYFKFNNIVIERYRK